MLRFADGSAHSLKSLRASLLTHYHRTARDLAGDCRFVLEAAAQRILRIVHAPDGLYHSSVYAQVPMLSIVVYLPIASRTASVRRRSLYAPPTLWL